MKKILLLVCLLSGPFYSLLQAQTPELKGLNTINQQTAEAHIGFLADDLLEGREAGFKGAASGSHHTPGKSISEDAGTGDMRRQSRRELPTGQREPAGAG